MNWVSKTGYQLVCILFLGIAPSAFALELKRNFYVGGGVGVSDYDLQFIEDFAASDPDTTYDEESEAVAYSLVAGWNFLDQFSAEFIYMDFGGWETSETELDTLTGELEAEWLDEGQISGFGFAARYDFAVSNEFDVYARLGMLSWEMELESTNSNYYYDETTRRTTDFDGTDFLVSFGMKYALGDQLFLFGEFTYLDSALEKTFEDGEKLSEDLPVKAFMGGIQYYFSAPTRKRMDGSTVEPQSERARDITACDPKYQDISGIMCDQ